MPWGWLFQERGWDGESSPHVLCSLTCCSRHGLLASNLPATSPRQRLKFPGPLEAGLRVLPSPYCQHEGPVPLCCFRAVSPVHPRLWFETSPHVALVLSFRTSSSPSIILDPSCCGFWVSSRAGLRAQMHNLLQDKHLLLL